jgi:hypothetical protein
LVFTAALYGAAYFFADIPTRQRRVTNQTFLAGRVAIASKFNRNFTGSAKVQEPLLDKFQ